MLLDYFKLVILLSIPQALIHIWLTFEFWGLKPTLHYRKLVLYAIMNSLIVDLDIWSVSMPVHMLTSTCLNFIVMFFVFRSFGIRKILIVFIQSRAPSIGGVVMHAAPSIGLRPFRPGFYGRLLSVAETVRIRYRRLYFLLFIPLHEEEKLHLLPSIIPIFGEHQTDPGKRDFAADAFPNFPSRNIILYWIGTKTALYGNDL